MEPRRACRPRYVLLVAASFLLICNGCDWIGLSGSRLDDEPIVVHATEPFELALGQTAVIAKYDLTITFIDVDDSRCPQGVMCVWSGMVRSSFRLERARETIPVTISGFVGGEVQREGLAEDAGRFRVEVLAMAPYPTIDGGTSSVPTATLVVRLI